MKADPQRFMTLAPRWASVRSAELEGMSFRCLEGCGFCCTFQPEVSGRELGLLRQRLAPKPVPVAVGEDRSYLRLQNKCGACTLLERRGCTQYDLRPAHCRYFPFHLHFAEEPEAYVNYTCRGVERDAPTATLHEAFTANVLKNAPKGEVERHTREAKEAYGAFKRLARRKGAWGDADAVTARLLAQHATMFTDAGLTALTKGAGLDADLDALHEEALRPFGAQEVTHRPFYLAPDLRWLTFARPAPSSLDVLEMDETGHLEPITTLDGLGAWEAPPPAIADGLAAYAARLTARRLWAGTVYALVDDDEYETSVEEAVHARFVELVCDLTLRARVLEALDTPAATLVDEVARFYDSTFLDAPTIGGFL